MKRSSAGTFQDFYHLLQNVHQIPRLDVLLGYTDVHGDLLPINNDDNYHKALSSANPLLRVIIQKKGQWWLEKGWDLLLGIHRVNGSVLLALFFSLCWGVAWEEVTPRPPSPCVSPLGSRLCSWAGVGSMQCSFLVPGCKIAVIATAQVQLHGMDPEHCGGSSTWHWPRSPGEG